MRRKTIDDEVDEIVETPYAYFEQSVTYKVHHYYLSDAVEEPSRYTEMIHRIKTGSPSDTIHIHLNTPGGQLDTGIQIINAMQTSEAHIICSIESRAHSLGTLIFLAADEFIVHENCMMMIHNYSGGMWGKGNEQIAQLAATTEHFNTLAEDIYIPFVTKEELEEILNGSDLWLQTEDIRTRLVKMVKIMEREAKEALAPPPKKKRVTKKKKR